MNSQGEAWENYHLISESMGKSKAKIRMESGLAKRWAPYNSRARGKVLMSVLPVPACSAVSMAIVCSWSLAAPVAVVCCLLLLCSHWQLT